MALEDAWDRKLAAEAAGALRVNWILVDFHNTTVLGDGFFGRISLVPNAADGLVRAVRDVNARRQRAYFGRLRAEGSSSDGGVLGSEEEAVGVHS